MQADQNEKAGKQRKRAASQSIQTELLHYQEQPG